MSVETETKNVSAVITAENTFTDALQVDPGERVSISAIRNSFTGTYVVQRKLRGQSAYQDVANQDGTIGWTGRDIETSYVADEACEMRMGVKTGGFTGTNVTCRLGKG